MKCPNCGEIKNIEIIATIATKQPTQETALFCGKCGTRLAEEVQLTPIQDVLRQAELPKDSLLEQLRRQLEKQALEGVRQFVKALDDAQWLKLENELRVLGCSEWVGLFLKLLRITEMPHDSSKEN